HRDPNPSGERSGAIRSRGANGGLCGENGSAVLGDFEFHQKRVGTVNAGGAESKEGLTDRLKLEIERGRHAENRVRSDVARDLMTDHLPYWGVQHGVGGELFDLNGHNLLAPNLGRQLRGYVEPPEAVV